MITVSKEDYLKSILEAETEGETVISARRNYGASPPEEGWFGKGREQR